MRTFIAIASITLIVFAAASDAGDTKKLKASERWTGKSADEDLRKHAPKAGYITSQKAFDELWAAWRDKDKTPKVDFTKNIVFVHLGGGPNIPGASYTLDDKGDLRSKAVQTLIGGKGFGYSIDVLPREGIKSYQGKPIESTRE